MHVPKPYRSLSLLNPDFTSDLTILLLLLQVDRFVVRDNNMRLNARERFAVQEWVQSPSKSFHVMRDHWLHCDAKAPMRGGTQHTHLTSPSSEA